jgi:hypothetical protein
MIFLIILTLQLLRGYKISKLLIETILETFFYVKKLLTKNLTEKNIFRGRF